jgi:hypothetical protein
MTDETKELFDAPWEASYDGEAEMLEVYDADHDRVCIIDDFADAKHAKRLARLPELYDALMEAAGGKCWSCAGANVSAILNDGCPKGNDETCYVAKWIELLRKVRDGK